MTGFKQEAAEFPRVRWDVILYLPRKAQKAKRCRCQNQTLPATQQNAEVCIFGSLVWVVDQNCIYLPFEVQVHN